MAPQGAPAPSIDAVLQDWLASHALGRKASTRHFHAEIATAFRRLWPGSLQEAPHQVSRSQVLEFASRAAGFCPSRWNALFSILSLLCNGRPDLVAGIRRRGIRFRDYGAVSDAQLGRLFAACDGRRRSQVGLVARFLVLSGLRIGEAMALTWSDVGGEIRVPAAAAKSGRARCVPLVAGMAEVLARLRALEVPGGYVLPRGTIRKALALACRAAGIPRVGPHFFRHVFATRCIECGVDAPTVARWLGHQDGGALVARMYFHLLDGHSREMAGRVRIAA